MDAVADGGLENATLILLTGDNGGGDDQCAFAGNNAPFTGAWQAAHGGGGRSMVKVAVLAKP